MKKILMCFLFFVSNILNGAERECPSVQACLDPRHPSGINLEKLRERSCFMAESSDPSTSLDIYLNLKKKLSEIFNATETTHDESTKLLINELMCRAKLLKFEICQEFKISESQLHCVENPFIPSINEAPTLQNCLNAPTICGVNFNEIAKREEIYRLNGIADDVSTYIILYRDTKAKINSEECQERKLALTKSLHDLAVTLKSKSGLSYEQIFAIN